MLGGSPRYTDDKVPGSDEGIKLGSTDGKVLGTILGNVDGITPGFDSGTYMAPLDRSFDGSNDDNLEGLFLEDSPGYTGGKFIGYNEGIKLGLFDVEVLGTLLRNVYGITLGFSVRTELGFLDE